MKREVKYDYKVTFKNVDGTDRPVSLVSPEQVITADNLEINPRELYSIVQVPIIALNFPWDRYPFIEVFTEYKDEANGIRMDDAYILKSDVQEKVWRMFVRDPARTQFRYKLIFRAVDNRDIEKPWVETADERITIRDPYPSRRTLTIVPNLVWSQVERAFVDVSYEDPDNDVFKDESFEFSETNSATKTFNVALVNRDLQRVAYQATIMFKDGRMVEVPRSFTLDRRIIIRGDLKGHKIILVRPPAIDFAAKKLKEITVDMRYEDAEAGLSFIDSFRLKSPEDRANFEFDYADEQKSAYEYQVTYSYTNGLSKSTDWVRENDEELRVPVG